MDILKEIYKKDRLKRFINFLLGITLVALAFNIFMKPNGIISGLSGIAIIVEKYFNITPSLLIFVVNIFLLLLSYFTLGFNKTRSSIIGALLYPILIELTKPIVDLLNFGEIETIVIVICGAVVLGFGFGLLFKAGFTTGGSDIIEQIICKYAKISMGNSVILIDGLIICLTLFTLGFKSFIYSIIAIYIESIIIDKVLLGISKSKTLYIITENETDVKKFILNNLSHGITILDGRGGYTGNNQKVIMCIIPTKEYFIAKEGIKNYDKNAFVLATDTYEVLGGK